MEGKKQIQKADLNILGEANTYTVLVLRAEGKQ